MADITELPASPSGQITHNDVRNKINEAIQRINVGLPEFEAYSTLPSGVISDDEFNPSYMPTLQFVSEVGGFEIVTTGPWANTGAILNNTGFDLDMIGAFDFFADNSGATSTLEWWSETSADGILITPNALSHRRIEVSSSNETTQTKSSRMNGWSHGTMLRFAVYDSGGGTIQLTTTTVQANGTTSVTQPSFFWSLATARFA